MAMEITDMLDRTKLDLRIDFPDLDADITDNIRAALGDLGIAGVNTEINEETETGLLILRAVKLFCRWQYDFDGKGDKYEKAYNMLKAVLAIDLDTRAVED